MLIQSFNLNLITEKAQSLVILALMEFNCHELALDARGLNFAHFVGYDFLSCIKYGFRALAARHPGHGKKLKRICHEALKMGKEYYPGLIERAEND